MSLVLELGVCLSGWLSSRGGSQDAFTERDEAGAGISLSLLGGVRAAGSWLLTQPGSHNS
jgi:hypothetical protein